MLCVLYQKISWELLTSLTPRLYLWLITSDSLRVGSRHIYVYIFSPLEIMEIVTDFIFLGSKITADGDCSHEIKRPLLFLRKAMTNLDSVLKSKRYYFANKGLYKQNYGVSSSHVRMWELDHKEGWAPKNWCFWNCGVGEDSWESLGLQGDQTR